MPINLNIAAQVVDVRSDRPLAVDRFLVDTNVWYWTTYSQASHNALSYRVHDYPAYLQRARAAKAELFYCTLSSAELMHIIERSEWEIFRNGPPVNSVTVKEYRHNYPQERQWVLAEIESVWSQVKSIAKPLDVTVDTTLVEAALTDLATTEVDGYDLFILQAMRHQGITQIITDDGDFATAQGIQMFTSNGYVISQAKAQNQLLTR